MRFLKVLVNALICGLVLCFLIAHLLNVLNINRPMNLRLMFSVFFRLIPFYALAAALFIVAGFYIVQFFGGIRSWPGLISPVFLSLNLSLVLFVFLAVFWANSIHFQSLFSSVARTGLRNQMLALLVLALLGLATFLSLLPLKKKMPLFLVYVVLLCSGLGYLLTQKKKAIPTSSGTKQLPLLGKRVDKKITLIGLEGLCFDFLNPLFYAGKLPNLSYLKENGWAGKMINFTPTETVVLRTSLETGKLPAGHGVVSHSLYHLRGLSQELEVIPRFILFHQLTKTGYLRVRPSQPAAKTLNLWEILEGNRIPYLRFDQPKEIERPQPTSRAERTLANVFNNPILIEDQGFQRAKEAFFRDFIREERAAEEKSRREAQVFYLYLDGLDTVQNFFYKYSFPEQFGGIEEESLAKYGTVIENYYAYYDGLIGKYLTGLKEDEILLVFSLHGSEPLPVWQRFVERLLGDRNISAHHERAPEGAIFFYGSEIAPARQEEGIRIIDIAPTLLYYLGLPVGRDMDGLVRSSLFRSAFTADNPIIYISSYDEFMILPPR